MFLLPLIASLCCLGASPAPVPPVPPPTGWEEGPGYGVASRDTGNPLGDNIFIGYAGYRITLAEAQRWVAALYEARLRQLGVRTVVAVQGPRGEFYEGQELGNRELVAALSGWIHAGTRNLIVAGHSSGAYVANDFLEQLRGSKLAGRTAGKVVYFNLDGGDLFLGPKTLSSVRRAYCVSAYSASIKTHSANSEDMTKLAARFPGKGGVLVTDASAAGCTKDSVWCLHISLINTRPHDPTGASGIDYADFQGRPVETQWLDRRARDAQLLPP